jgi:hypothetical protein
MQGKQVSQRHDGKGGGSKRERNGAYWTGRKYDGGRSAPDRGCLAGSIRYLDRR